MTKSVMDPVSAVASIVSIIGFLIQPSKLEKIMSMNWMSLMVWQIVELLKHRSQNGKRSRDLRQS